MENEAKYLFTSNVNLIGLLERSFCLSIPKMLKESFHHTHSIYKLITCEFFIEYIWDFTPTYFNLEVSKLSSASSSIKHIFSNAEPGSLWWRLEIDLDLPLGSLEDNSFKGMSQVCVPCSTFIFSPRVFEFLRIGGSSYYSMWHVKYRDTYKIFFNEK